MTTMRRQWLNEGRRRVAPRVLALVGVLGIQLVAWELARQDCARAVEGNNLSDALEICRAEYLATNDPFTGARYADQWRRSDREGARAFVTTLIGTRAQPDAYQVLGKIAYKEGQQAEAQRLLEIAHTLHFAELRFREAAVDNQQIALIYKEQHRFADALRSLDSCIREAHTGQATRIEGYCHVTAAQVLSEIGHYQAADHELEQARSQLVMERGRDDLEVQLGTAQIRNGFGPLRFMSLCRASTNLKKAISDAKVAANLYTQSMAELNLVYVLAELSGAGTNKTCDADHDYAAEAMAHLDTARLLDVRNEGSDERTYLAGRIAYRSGDFAQARALDAAVFDKLDGDEEDFRLHIAVAEADMALKSGALEEAIRWASRGVEIADPIRKAGDAVELRAWILSARREPYEQLFVAYVKSKRFDDAIVAFDHWQARTLLDELARGTATPPPTLGSAALVAEGLNKYLPTLSQAPVVQLANRDALLPGVDNVDLIALTVADDTLWRITSYHGQRNIVEVGSLHALTEELDKFRSNATSTELGDALGEKLLGSEPFRKTDEPLYIVLDSGTPAAAAEVLGAVSGLPVVALRSHGKPLIAFRPIIHPVRLSELRCITPIQPARTHVIADSTGNLSGARREAETLAASTHGVLSLERAATRAAVFEAGPGDHLHIAVHGEVGDSGGELKLSDGTLSALEISGRHNSPASVFLDACDSAAATDRELAGSVAAAFLASGSQQVVATLRSVDDEAAAELAGLFYAGNGIADPAIALAHAQAALSETNNPDWPYFVLYGHDICREGTK